MKRSVLPGFKLTLGYTLAYLTLIVLIPLLTLPLRAASVPWDQLTATITDPRVVASYGALAMMSGEAANMTPQTTAAGVNHLGMS